MRKVGKFCFKLFLSAVLLSLGFHGAAADASRFETLNVGLPGDAIALDTMRAVDTMSFSVAGHISQSLVTVDGGTRELIPVLAERWEILDPQTYKFFLRQGVTFHNGEPFTAEDVVFSLTRAATDSIHAQSRGRFIDPDGFEIIDDHTVIVRTNGPVGGWLETMKHPYAVMKNRRAVEEAGDDYFRNPVGTGPFRFRNWVRGERIELEAFDDYHGQKPNFRYLNFLVIPDNSSRVIALETGAVDMIYAVPPGDVERLNASPDTQVVIGQGLVMIYMGMNTQRGPLSDPRVREAIHHAINKEAYNLIVYQGFAVIPDGPLPPAAAYIPQGSQRVPYDLERARELLQEAGYGDGFPLRLWVINFQDRISGATVMQSMLAQIGIDVQIEVFEAGTFQERMRTGEHDLFIHTWGMQTNRDVGHFWLSLFHSNSAATNMSLLNDELIDELLDLSNATLDTDARNVMFQQIWDRLGELRPIIGLSIPSELYGGRAGLRGMENFFDGRINYLGNLQLYLQP